MHPVNYLFEDIYRNDWSITSNVVAAPARGSAICVFSWSASGADRHGIFGAVDWIDSSLKKGN